MSNASFLKATAGRFARATDGATSMIFAIVTIALCGCLGLSIDMVRANRAQTAMQTVVDGGVIAVAAAKQLEIDAGKDALDAYLLGNWKTSYGTSPPVTTYDEPDAQSISVTANATMETIFMKVVGLSSLNLKVKATGRFGVGVAEVALALDTTKSMEGSKLDALKDAAEKLVKDVYKRPEAASKIKFSVVPFSQYVNVGTQYRGQSWLSVPNDSTGTYCTKKLLSTNGCVKRTAYWYDDGKPVAYEYDDCPPENYETVPTDCSNYDIKWNGCVGSRSSSLDTNVELSAGQPESGIMQPRGWCGSPLTRLTNDEHVLRDAIKDLEPNGETYMAPGLLWAWRTLAPVAPFADGAPRTGPSRARKVIVLMTDGKNTASAHADTLPAHEGWDGAVANVKTKAICDKAKAEDKIEIFSIAFEVTDPSALDVLQYCSTSPVTHYFNATDGIKLAESFKKIGSSLSMVRLTK